MKQAWMKKVSAALCTVLLCATVTMSIGTVFATGGGAAPPSTAVPQINIISNLASTQTVAKGKTVVLAVAAEILEQGYTLEYKWFKDGNEQKDANGNTINKNSITVSSDALGTYRVAIYCKETNGKIVNSVYSTECTVSLGEVLGGKGSLYITGYTVQDATGAEKQRIGVGEKCQIVVGVRDGRFTEIPTKTDAYGNIANFKITSTASFSTPTFGDIRMTSPTMVNGELDYAIVFNDIMYTGGENKLGVDVSYNDQSTAMQNVSVGISQCFNPAEMSTTKPAVMVKDFSFGGANVDAGSTFALNLTSYNTSKLQGISDVTTSLSLPATITIAGGSNVALHSVVPPSGSFADVFSLHVQNSAETGVANVTVTYTFYVEGSEAPITSSQIVAVPVVQPDRFSFTSLEMPDELYAGEENTITVNYVNKGKGILYNVSAEITGNIDNPGQGQYMGNLNSGTEGTVDFVVKTEGMGPVSGVVTISYEDINGNVKQQTQPFSGDMLPASTGGDMPMPPDIGEMPTEQTGMPWWGWTLIGVGGVGAAGTAVGVMKKAKAKKRDAELAEDDEDEIS